ncbi:hypothetical protein IC744_11020 [Microbacterium hominis]|uniref:hypothetical protein n=1 Tax=Microbacterium TaxID=33882 RepID=UPI00168A467D|nr:MULTISPECIES: hypothetical protein [Microbacterium]QOC26809.1 hypothetical protein IC745_05275 [Microbacterium hominis]QOC27986.1 hypothetical protein IC744_11020 [Microbacterium hominis]QYF96864.1 DUF3137 domain-containing protein [Microbacterium sp. PAMC21962]
MSTPAASSPFDARPLIEPADRAAVRAYVRELRAGGHAPAAATSARVVMAVIVGVVFAIVFGSTILGVLAGAMSAASAAVSGDGFTVLAFAPVVMLVAVVAVLAVGIVRAFGARTGERWWRLDRFARANAMTWYPSVPAPPLPGMVFGLGHGREATDVVRGESPRFVEFGNYVYRTGSGKNESTHRWGYVAVKLATPLPNIVLDALGNNGLFGSTLPAAFDGAQRLSLEGDFDRYFTLYCPSGYEADALYLFTPDIMARFVDHAAALDVEIVDDWLFLYTQREASTLDPATWAWLFSVVAALLDKLAQWERWRDDRLAPPATAVTTHPATGDATTGDAAPAEPAPARLPFAAPTASLRPPPGVAPAGRRLRRRVPWAAIIIIGAVLMLMLFGPLGVFASLIDNLSN